jgi:hypothetical protein
MTAEEFESTMCRLKRQKPFLPFVVELLDGRSILVDRPKIAIGGGGATLVKPRFNLVEIECEQVRAIRMFTKEARA